MLGDASPEDFLNTVHADVESYGAFNLVVGDREGTWACGTADEAPRKLEDGIHVISNGRIGVHWPKTERLRDRFVETIDGDRWTSDDPLLDLLIDETRPSDAALPDTGVGIELERLLAPVFVRGSAQYGTRASTLAYFDLNRKALLRERLFRTDVRMESDVSWSRDTSSEEWCA
jgi:uncharacterized protein with NRDE domain